MSRPRIVTSRAVSPAPFPPANWDTMTEVEQQAYNAEDRHDCLVTNVEVGREHPDYPDATKHCANMHRSQVSVHVPCDECGRLLCSQSWSDEDLARLDPDDVGRIYCSTECGEAAFDREPQDVKDRCIKLADCTPERVNTLLNTMGLQLAGGRPPVSEN